MAQCIPRNLNSCWSGDGNWQCAACFRIDRAGTVAYLQANPGCTTTTLNWAVQTPDQIKPLPGVGHGLRQHRPRRRELPATGDYQIAVGGLKDTTGTYTFARTG